MLKKITLSISDTNPGAKLHGYLHDNLEKPAPAVVLCPGGAYIAVGLDPEGESSALGFFNRGFQAFVLEYSIGLRSAWPTTVVEASRALALIRSHAQEWQISPDRIAVGGFSAGGGVSLCLGTYWDDPDIQAAAGVSGRENRPDALIQLYTTYRALPLFTEEGLQEFEPDCIGRITSDTPPAFWAHTYEDGNGSMEYAMAAAAALSQCGVPSEVHVYTCGAHGQLSQPSRIGPDGIRTAGFYDWFDRCVEWLEDLFLRGMQDRKTNRAGYLPGRSMTCMVVHGDPGQGPFTDGILNKKAPLAAISDCPEAMDCLAGYVPYLKQFPLTEAALATSLGTWLEYVGYEQGNPFTQEEPEDAVKEILLQLTRILKGEQ